MTIAEGLKADIGTARAWNMPPSYKARLTRKTRNQFGTSLLFEDGSVAFVPKWTARILTR